MIELCGLRKSYGSHTVLQDIELMVQEGEIFGVIGRSGAGKSTLLRCINLLERPDCGDVMIDQENLTQLNPKQLRMARHKTAMIFQHFNLVNAKNVYENIALPMRIQGIKEDDIQRKIDELLPIVELEDKVLRYPAQLSGGQKQRVAIARALACSPKLLLCDEATSALDHETTESILALLEKINSIYGITIVLITHQMDVVKRICHRLALMEAGKIIETVGLNEIFSKRDSIARKMLYAKLSPTLPSYLSARLTDVPNEHPLVKLLFEGEGASIPFISKTSRELHIDINILLANIDQFGPLTCGVLIAELTASAPLLQTFIQRCSDSGLIVEIIGYVNSHVA